MNREEKINQEIQKTLDSFNEVEVLKADAFYYTRLKARMRELESQQRKLEKGDWFLGILKPVLILVLVALNIYTATVFLIGDKDTESSQEDLVALFAKDFALDSGQYNPTFMINE